LNEEEYLQDLQDVNMLLVELAHSRAISHKNIQEEFKDFDKCKAEEIVEENFKEIKNKYIESAVDEKNRTKLDTYFDAIKEYIVENIEIFSEFQFEGTPQEYKMEEKMRFEEYFKLISVNLLVDNKDLKHAPVIFCDTIDDEFDLIGGVLYETDKRSFTTETDFSKIEAGDLLKANGGYLVVEAKDIILKDLWEDFKKSLTNRKVKLIGKNSTTVALSDTLEAEPINIDVKVILIGDLNLHYVLFEEDPMFEELFEIHAKFNDSIDRTPDNEVLYARLIKLICEEESLNVLSYDALCKTIEYSSKVVEKQSKLALSYSKIYKLLIEADKLSTLRGSDLIDIEDIEKAIENKIKRVDNASKYRDESIMDNITVLSVNDSKIGEVNALTVIDYSEYAIGSVSKLTANTYRNKKYSIVSSDKEGLLTGNIHDKALNIVTGFLGETFGKKEVFPYSINISFEQCYGGIEGDSATLAKTCAILSNLSKTPIKQCYGITGSMNQKGEAQCIGGVNEKIEGFFDLCKVKGLESGGGVIIPRANIKDLMLSEDVLEAIEKGKFTIYAVDNIEDAVKILTGKSFDSLCKTIKKTFEEK
jgi:Lon-like ATP-dependent protease